jgi:hypothetical protein
MKHAASKLASRLLLLLPKATTSMTSTPWYNNVTTVITRVSRRPSVSQSVSQSGTTTTTADATFGGPGDVMYA